MKKTLATVTMALVLGSSTVFANGGIIYGGRDAGTTRTRKVETCTQAKDGILVSDRSGILVSDRSGIFGLVLMALEGILVSDKATTCNDREGILVSDREGIIYGG